MHNVPRSASDKINLKNSRKISYFFRENKKNIIYLRVDCFRITDSVIYTLLC